jgi:hypothetical protein
MRDDRIHDGGTRSGVRAAVRRGLRLAPRRCVVVPLVLALTSPLSILAHAGSSGSEEVYAGVSSRLHSLTAITRTAREHADHPRLALISAMVPWRALEPRDDVFDWAGMDANIEDARANGYRLIVRIMAGRASPAWLAGAGAATLRLLGTDPNASDYCGWISAPVPWDRVLASEYREMIGELGRWLDGPDGAGGRRADHVYLVPVSMPTVLGTEMTLGYGANVRCPAGTAAPGVDLAATNRARWETVSTEPQRRRWVEAAWRRAIEIHMRQLPPETNSVIAYGAVFGDGHAASLRIATEEVARHSPRLWSMYTNLQPLVRADGSLGPWRSWCRGCHRVISAAIANGGRVGFQAAAAAVNDTLERFRITVEDALTTYGMRFLETGSRRMDRYESYLLTGSDPLQDRIARAAQPPTPRFPACGAIP